ncbi:MAG: excinuclease ABC subunit UvrC [Gammaproteobacteria bacterium]
MLKIPEKKFIRDFLKELPSEPGVYKFQDKKYNSIYIGKAKNLRKRVTSYFSDSEDLSRKVQNIIKESVFIDLVITKSELEALLFEQNRIKEERPKYNVQFKDDKGYPWIKIETSKEFPAARSFLGKKNKEDLYFGPFPSSYAVRGVIDLIQKTFKLRDCSDSSFKNRSRPCMQYQINKCSAPCVGEIDKDEYIKEVEDAKNLLLGGAENLIDKFYLEMDINSEKKAYERASIYRDKISSLREVQRDQNIAGFSKERDAISICRDDRATRIGLTQVRGGWITGHKNFVVNGGETENELISNFILNYYSNKKVDFADIVSLESIEDRETLENSISSIQNKRINILKKLSKKDLGLLEISKSNTEFSLRRAVKKKKELTDRFASLKDFLNMENKLFLIDSLDISHHAGQNAVGGVVAYNPAGRIAKECRAYNISKLNSGNDIASTMEVIERRYGNSLIKKKLLPDLLIIDGGRTHLKAANTKLKELGINEIKVISISKGVRRKSEYDLIHRGNSKPVSLSNNDLSKLLIQEIRDETHRFSIFRHRKKSKKRITESSLDSISGLGKKRKTVLLRYFGSLEQIRRASPEDISKVPGIGKHTSQLVYNHLN